MGYSIWPDGKTGDVLSEVNEERNRQEELVRSGKFLFTCASDNLSPARKLAILAEEVGEAAKEVTDLDIELDKVASFRMAPAARVECQQAARKKYLGRLRKELIQVAAVAVAWAESIEES